MLLRKELLSLSIDVEHFAKVKLLGTIEEEGEDGYSVVFDFLSENPQAGREIERGRSSVYIAGLLDRYSAGGFPAWAFMEVISFGTFCSFYRFCARRFSRKDMLSRYYLLMEVKNFRNACAHNNCVLNDLGTAGGARTSGRTVTQALALVPGIGKSQRRLKMRNKRLAQIVTTLFMHRALASEGVKEHTAKSLSAFLARMNKHLEYYKGVDSVASTFTFLTKVVLAWYPLGETG
jgi:hypothetical protein